MPTNTRAVALALLLIAGTNVASGFSRTTRRTQWFLAENNTAVAIGDDATAVARLLASLTMARAVMQTMAGVESLPPVRAFAVKNEAALRELVPQYWERRAARPYGASYTGPHNAFIAVRTDLRVAQQFPLLLHEYVHLLTAANVPDAPAWLDEGLSEFWGAVVLDGSRAVVGRPPAQYLKLLRTRTWLPLGEVTEQQRGRLTLDSGRASMFYAQSWAMVHYLLIGQNAAAPPTFAPSDRQLTPQLAAAVRAYVTAGRFPNVVSGFSRTVPAGVNVESAFGRTQPQPISEARALAERANMVVFGERPDATLPLARKALSLDSRDPLALEVMGTYYFLRNQPEQARVWLQQALDADHARFSSALYLALLSSSAPDRERYLLAAVSAKPDLAVAWQRLWTLYGEDGRGDQARRWCDRAAELLRPGMLVERPVRCGGQDRQ